MSKSDDMNALITVMIRLASELPDSPAKDAIISNLSRLGGSKGASGGSEYDGSEIPMDSSGGTSSSRGFAEMAFARAPIAKGDGKAVACC